ncbi:hypothetical protein GCM10027084_21450 [Pseudoxanthomonas sangjuensis]|nr:hypothetical protein CSC71_02695 [Pseudoxanthomonas sangjuensis]
MPFLAIAGAAALSFAVSLLRKGEIAMCGLTDRFKSAPGVRDASFTILPEGAVAMPGCLGFGAVPSGSRGRLARAVAGV